MRRYNWKKKSIKSNHFKVTHFKSPKSESFIQVYRPCPSVFFMRYREQHVIACKDIQLGNVTINVIIVTQLVAFERAVMMAVLAKNYPKLINVFETVNLIRCDKTNSKAQLGPKKSCGI